MAGRGRDLLSPFTLPEAPPLPFPFLLIVSLPLYPSANMLVHIHAQKSAHSASDKKRRNAADSIIPKRFIHSPQWNQAKA